MRAKKLFCTNLVDDSFRKQIIAGQTEQSKEKDELPRRVLHFSPSPGKVRHGFQTNINDIQRMETLSTFDAHKNLNKKDLSPEDNDHFSSNINVTKSPSLNINRHSQLFEGNKLAYKNDHQSSRADSQSGMSHVTRSHPNEIHTHHPYNNPDRPSSSHTEGYNGYGVGQSMNERKFHNYDSSIHHLSDPTSTSRGHYDNRNFTGSYSTRTGMQASRLAYEQDRAASNGGSISNNRHHTHGHSSSSRRLPDCKDDARNTEKSNDPNLKHHPKPQASPVPERHELFRHGSSDRNHRRPLNDVINDGERKSHSINGDAERGHDNGVNRTLEGYSDGRFDYRSNNFQVSPAVAISRRGCSKRRSPYDERYRESQLTINQASPQSLPRHASAVRYCTPIVTGGDRSRTAIFPPSTDYDSENGKHQNRLTPSSKSPHYEDTFDSHLRHYHRPYPSAPSPTRFDVSPKRASPGPYATPDISRGQSSTGHSQDPHREISFYENNTYPNQSFQRSNGKENFYFGGTAPHYMPYGSRVYSPYAAPGMIGGHVGYRTHSHLPPHDMPNATKKRRLNQNEGNNKKTKPKAAKPPRRKKMYSDFVGVTYNKTHAKFQACITHYRKQHYLGRYKLAVDAAKAYDESAKELKGDGWKINFQSEEEYELAKQKELDKNEKKRVDALAAEKISTNETGAKSLTLKPLSNCLQSLGNSDSEEKRNSMPALNRQVQFQNVSETTTKATRRPLPTAQQSSSAVTPSPHAHNLNKQSCLMNEPLISPMVKPNVSSSPSLLPTPLKPVAQSFPEKESPIAVDSFISSAIFTSPLQNMPSEQNNTKIVEEQKPNVKEPTKGNLTHLDREIPNELKDTKQSNGGASTQSQNGALAAASALLMIRQ